MKETCNLGQKVLGDFHGIRAKVINHDVWGLPSNALELRFPETRNVLSGRQGFRRVDAVFNCYLPDALWPLIHRKGEHAEKYTRDAVRATAGNEVKTSRAATLLTGVTMDHLAWAEEQYEDIWVVVFATAGVKTNALRIGVDTAGGRERNGQYEKIGTINTIVATSARMSQAAMAASFITVTEAKVIVMEDMNIRSVYTPSVQASGTGTDQIVVVSGLGDRAKYVGGHTKLGELMGRATTRAIRAALETRFAAEAKHLKENGL